MVSKYYAIVAGVKPGVYTDWATAERMVKGYPGALFKSFRSRGEAEAFLAKSTAVTNTVRTTPHTLPLIDKTIIYTDGSFAQGLCGFGIVIITSNGDKLVAYGRVPETVQTNGPTNNVAELYAIYVALSLVKGDVILYSDSQYSINSLTTHIHDYIQKGWSGIANRNLIEGAYGQMTGRTVTLQYVPGHSKIELNEEADRLAEQGRAGNEPLVVVKNGQRVPM